MNSPMPPLHWLFHNKIRENKDVSFLQQGVALRKKVWLDRGLRFAVVAQLDRATDLNAALQLLPRGLIKTYQGAKEGSYGTNAACHSGGTTASPTGGSKALIRFEDVA